MRIYYEGQKRATEFSGRDDNRYAVIVFEQGTQDEVIADRIVDLAIKTTEWKSIDGFNDDYWVLVDDKEDYNDFVQFYKRAKKVFRDCMKYGF